ncbi:translationally-controlled tumor protein homolog [Corythoichthys intestinalis]|uniref:translationally-controlled tumor protein homolog n=1 Tax=Corythoichthys intestinalis TaxID=161448 RepID=UPI0025A50D43|nr:translationally-controlled tumor protein homolog [Corythoichthys intestinalis]XP_057709432.1 translationally-controlled tumor protein homolog [Corythoichthys intestinalis]
MIIYKCILTDDEMFSDVYPIKETPIFYEVDGKHITQTDDIDDSLIGGNKSAEDQGETTEASVQSGVNIIVYHKLQQTSFDKKGYLSYIKEYLKAIKAKLQENNPERVDQFMADANVEVKKLLPGFKNLEFYTGESMNIDGMVGILDYREDDTPFMRFFKDGLIGEKC